MRKIVYLLFFFCIFSCNCVIADMVYSEDNAAYWYKKTFNNLRGIYESISSKDSNIIYNLKSLDDFNKLTPDTKKKLAEILNSFLADIKKAKDLNKCVFWEMPVNDSFGGKQQFQDLKMFFRDFKVANALAWYSISENKPNSAGLIWQTMLKISINISENNLYILRTVAGSSVIKMVIDSLDNYCSNGANNKFKTKFANYLKKWPKSIFDIKDLIKVLYDYQKNNIELYEKDQKFLATLFGADIKVLINDKKPEPKIIENQECASNRRVIRGAIEMFQMDEADGNLRPSFYDIDDPKEREKAIYKWREEEVRKKRHEIVKNQKSKNKNKNKDFDDDLDDELEEDINDNLDESKKVEKKEATDFSKLSWEETINLLLRFGYIRKNNNYNCPANGKTTVKAPKNNGEYEYDFDVTCNCGIKKDLEDDFKPDSKPMEMAKGYRETKFETDKKQLFEYYEMLLKIDQTKPINDKELFSLNAIEMPEYKNNALVSYFTFDYARAKKEFEERQKLIDDFIKKYGK